MILRMTAHIVAGLLTKTLSTILKIALLLIGYDMMRKKKSEARAKMLAQHEAQRRMNEFLSNASHDLRTPLTSIKGNIQLMIRRLRASMALDANEETAHTLEEAYILLERTDQQITRLTRLVNTLLESSRTQTNSLDLLLELCELDVLVHETVRERHTIPQERTIHVYVPADKTVLVMADINRIRQVIIHYLSNAHKYSHLHHPIEVKLYEDGRMARVLIQDKGPGLSAEEQRRVWDQFYRVPGIEVHNGTDVGLGLGLHISRKVIEQHNGRVGVQSTKGEGSAFWFTLPIVTKETLF